MNYYKEGFTLLELMGAIEITIELIAFFQKLLIVLEAGKKKKNKNKEEEEENEDGLSKSEEKKCKKEEKKLKKCVQKKLYLLDESQYGFRVSSG